MNYLEFSIKILAFAVTLFLLLEFIVSCDTPTWKAGLIFGLVSIVIITVFFITKQHYMIKCPMCSTKISPIKHNISSMVKSKISQMRNSIV